MRYRPAHGRAVGGLRGSDTRPDTGSSPAPGQPYEVKVPEGWARTDLATGADFTGNLNGIRIESTPATAASTEASVRS